MLPASVLFSFTYILNISNNSRAAIESPISKISHIYNIRAFRAEGSFLTKLYLLQPHLLIEMTEFPFKEFQQRQIQKEQENVCQHWKN